MDVDADAVAFAGRIVGDVGERDRLAPAGGEHIERRLVAACVGLTDLFDGRLLVRPEFDVHVPSRKKMGRPVYLTAPSLA